MIDFLLETMTDISIAHPFNSELRGHFMRLKQALSVVIATQETNEDIDLSGC